MNTHVKLTKPILQTKFFDVVEYEVEKDGRTHQHTNVIMNDDVFIVPLTDANEVYLISQYRYLLNEMKLEMPAGVIDRGEDIETAAKRELKEETGLTAGKLIKIATLDRGASFIKGKWHVYVAKELTEGEQELEEFEEITVVKMPIEEAVHKIITGEITTTGGVSAILLTYTLLKEGNI